MDIIKDNVIDRVGTMSLTKSWDKVIYKSWDIVIDKSWDKVIDKSLDNVIVKTKQLRKGFFVAVEFDRYNYFFVHPVGETVMP